MSTEQQEQVAWFTRNASLPQRTSIINFDETMGNFEHPRDLWVTDDGYIGIFGKTLFQTRREAAQAALAALANQELDAKARVRFLKDQRVLLEKHATGGE